MLLLPYIKPCCCWALQSMLLHTHTRLTTCALKNSTLATAEVEFGRLMAQTWKNVSQCATLDYSGEGDVILMCRGPLIIRICFSSDCLLFELWVVQVFLCCGGRKYFFLCRKKKKNPFRFAAQSLVLVEDVGRFGEQLGSLLAPSFLIVQFLAKRLKKMHLWDIGVGPSGLCFKREKNQDHASDLWGLGPLSRILDPRLSSHKWHRLNTFTHSSVMSHKGSHTGMTLKWKKVCIGVNFVESIWSIRGHVSLSTLVWIGSDKRASHVQVPPA